ncbi:amidohydrolase [Romboutsia faecis]|uniref:amidohydrolase n=1 Tax=Romboutsia faecis TaxID=2764597 RepID=UPI00129DBFE7|nr:amidohydrolase [Romboutsia faecis]
MDNNDIVIINAKVYTIDKEDSIKESIAIKNKKIIYVGNNKDINKYIKKDTKVIDAKGNIILPGMVDSHIHPPGTALTELYEVSLYGLNSIDEYKEAIRIFIDKNPDVKVVYGGGWSLGIFEGKELGKGPKKEHLDDISIDIPIVLRAYDGHTMWLNSKAFKEFNINIDTQCPNGGKIEINEETNELWGTLKESAIHIIEEHNYSEEEYMKAFELFQRKMHEFGITSILSMSGMKFGMSPNAYKRLFEEGKLKMRISNSIIIFSDEDIKSQIDEIKNIREKYDLDLFKTTTIKLLADGVIEGSTAYLLEPYKVEAGMGTDYYGEFLWKEEILENTIKYCNENNFSIHVHSVGDGSTKKVLDAVEKNYKLQEKKDFRNTITHLQLVNNNDIRRFKELSIIAAVQPYWHIKGPKWWDEVDYKLLGDRAKYEYPLNSFIKEGVIITSSSDHSVTPEPNPFYAIEAGVTRNLYNSKYFGVEDINNIDDERYLLNKDERISVMDMVKSFTINGAYAIFRENEIGSIEVGKYADFIVVDRDIFNIDPIDIEKTKVLITFFNGEIVYESNN